MANRLGALTGMSGKRIWIAVAVVVAIAALPALARALTVEITGEVYSDKCTPCHANYNSTNKHPTYIFTHGNHITYECRTCHPEFPHRPEGTDLPVMKDCWNCHGLRHGPQGVLATGVCTDCHGNKLEGLRPAFHTSDWAGKAHVQPANERLTTECSMCHTQSQCDECHSRENVFWSAPTPMVYDAKSGCLACHGSSNLIKATSVGVRSFQVSGIDQSAHRDLACPQCHLDFAYKEVKGQTNVWSVNAGMSCAQKGCHDTDDPATQKNEDQVTAYTASVHGSKIAAGNLKSATCGSCHGGHTIQSLKTDKAKRALQLASKQMCSGCHLERWDNYNDSYHGQAYKAGAADAPACWDCHTAHATQPASAPASTVNDTQLANTCSGDSAPEGCHNQHKKASESFIEQTASMIHKQYDERENNPIFKMFPFLNGGQ